MKAFHEIRQYDSDFMVWCSSYTNMSFLSHWHKEIELIFVREGSAKISVADHSFVAHEGDLIICDSECIHYSDSYQMNNILDFIVFDPGIVISLGQYFRFINPLLKREEIKEKGLTAFVDKLFLEIPEELKKKDTYYQEIVRGLLFEFWYKAKRSFPSIDPSKQTGKRYDIENMLQQLITYLENHYYENIPLSVAAEKMNFSQCYFSRCFKKYTGVNYITYVNILRIENAIYRLQNSSDKIASIALDCGFTELRTFNRVFRQFTSLTPSDFRRRKDLGGYSISFRNRKTPKHELVENDSFVVVKNNKKLYNI